MRYLTQADQLADFFAAEWVRDASGLPQANALPIANPYGPEFPDIDLFSLDFLQSFGLGAELPSGPTNTNIPGDTSTTASVVVGGQIDGTLDFSTDQDWYSVTLVTGQTYDISLLGIGTTDPLTDPLVRILDSNGTELANNDDIILGSVTNSLLTFTASADGVYYISAQAFLRQDGSTTTGDYTLSVTQNSDTDTDIAADDTTDAVAVINGSVSGSIDVANDADWFAVTLTAGQRYLISQNGTGADALADAVLTVFDVDGNQVANDDDSGPQSNARLSFTPETTGVYYIQADGFSTGTGDYALTVDEAPTLVLRTVDEVAHFLTDEFRGSQQSYSADGNGATINYSFDSGDNSLSDGAEALARQALAAWASVANITFIEGPGGIVFRNDGSGAFNSNSTVSGVVQSSDLNVAASWNGGNVNLDSYTYQTFLHEIGHALGLGHAGPYNGSATYDVDNAYLNDSWAYTVMSYFDQAESGYFGDVRFVLGPQIADIVAIQELYGANTSTRSGDTIYGFNSTETDVHNFDQFSRAPSLSIYDTGGIDTLDFSGYAQDQRIDLNAEAFSNINGIDGAISIARGVLIENAIGGVGIDTIIGNDADNVLTAGGGDDILDGGAGIDYAAYSGASIDSYTLTENDDGTITITDNSGADGSDTLTNIEFMRVGGEDINLQRYFDTTDILTESITQVTAQTGNLEVALSSGDAAYRSGLFGLELLTISTPAEGGTGNTGALGVSGLTGLAVGSGDVGLTGATMPDDVLDPLAGLDGIPQDVLAALRDSAQVQDLLVYVDSDGLLAIMDEHYTQSDFAEFLNIV